jgi:endogenous inhibitor of DNA gyrase (YacG/DUF329 family)
MERLVERRARLSQRGECLQCGSQVRVGRYPFCANRVDRMTLVRGWPRHTVAASP